MMVDPVQVAILIPVYNREDSIAASIESALAQDYPHLEIIISDNASSDHSWEIIKKYESADPRIKAFRNASNLGPIANWRRCLENSRSPYIKFLFSDDWLDTHAVSELLGGLRRHRGTRASYSATWVTRTYPPADRNIHYCLDKETVLTLSNFLEASLTSSSLAPVSPGCGIFLREDVETALRWSPSTEIGRDAHAKGFGPDLMMFLVAAGRGGVVALPEILSFFRSHKNSITIFSDPVYKVCGYRNPIADLPGIVTLTPTQKAHIEATLKAMMIKQSVKHPSLLPLLFTGSLGAYRLEKNGKVKQSTSLLRVLYSAFRLSIRNNILKRRINDLVNHWWLRLCGG